MLKQNQIFHNFKLFKSVFLLLILTILFLLFKSSSYSVVTVFDETGKKFTFLSPPKRIISTMPNNTEILFDLGVGKRIIAVSNRCDYPPQVKKLPKIGDLNLNIEKIISLNPDLIVMLYDTQKYQIEKLRSLKQPVFVINPKSLIGLSKSIELLGKVTGTEKRALELKNKINKTLEKAKSIKINPKPKVLVVLWVNPLVSAGRATIVEDIIEKSGGENIVSKVSDGYPTIDFEFVLKENPNYIIFAGKSYSEFKEIALDQKWQKLDAIKNGKVLLVDADIIIRPTMRTLKAVELISKFISEQ